MSPNASYHVTWYISWSPCFECAEVVERFLHENRNVSLRVAAARLYLCDQDDEQGLRDLCAAGAELDAMSPEGERRRGGHGAVKETGTRRGRGGVCQRA